MRPEQVVVAVSKYEAELQAKGLSPVRQNSALFPTPHSGLQHALWMCGEVKAQISRNEIEKAMRWLGFIQATLWMAGHATIDSMKDDNRSVV